MASLDSLLKKSEEKGMTQKVIEGVGSVAMEGVTRGGAGALREAAGQSIGLKNERAGDHFISGARGGNLAAGVAGAVIGTVTEPSRYDEPSLAAAANLAANPAAAAVTYGAIQMGGDAIGNKGVGVIEVAAAIAGAASGVAPVVALYGAYQGVQRFLTDDLEPEKATEPETAQNSDYQLGTNPAYSSSGHIDSPLAASESQEALQDLGWAPGGPR